MNLYIIINYIILSVVFSLLSIELISALTLFYNKNKFNDIKNIISPVWEMVGTFIIFFVVNTEVLYPDLLPIIAKLYTIPILLIALFIISRNAFLAYSEQMWKGNKIDSVLLARIYSISTLIISFLSLVVLISVLTGSGVNNNLTNFSFIQFFSNYYTLTLILGVILVLFGLSFVFYKLENNKKLSPIFTLLGLIILIFSFYKLGLYINFVIYIISIIIFLISLIYYLYDFSRKYIIFLINLISFLSIVILNYGRIFNNQSLLNYLNNTPVLPASFIITLLGGTLLIIMLTLFIYMFSRPSQGGNKYY
ncbi:hypothetical protein YN1_4890 [Nanoarchaeota archaeon]